MKRFGIIVAYNTSTKNCTIMASGEYDKLSDFRDCMEEIPHLKIMLLDFSEKEFEEIRKDSDKINKRFKNDFEDSSFADFTGFEEF